MNEWDNEETCSPSGIESVVMGKYSEEGVGEEGMERGGVVIITITPLLYFLLPYCCSYLLC